jgi:type II secretory pathway pseudopilin PulG
MVMRKRKFNQEGFTILEALVAGMLVSILAVSLFPAFYSMINRGHTSSFRIVCNSLVRAKLQQYVTGAGALAAGTTGLVPTGFEYTKYRYRIENSATANSCDPAPNGAGILTPGFREDTSDAARVADTAVTEGSLPPNLKGFQLWVNLRRYNPRVTPPVLDCPSVDYQFGEVGDGIEVTVTGMIRTEPPPSQGGRGGGNQASFVSAPNNLGPNAAYGGLRDFAAAPNPELTCSVTQIVYPPKLPFRYWLASDGRWRAFSQTAYGSSIQASLAGSFQSHFRTIWSSVPSNGSVNDPPIPNILSFAVSPDNTSVYVLKPGILLRYDGCTDQNVTVDGTVFYAVPDCPAAPAYTNTTDGIVPIQSIAVDFGSTATTNDDLVYMLMTGGPTDVNKNLKLLTISSGAITESATYTLPDLPRINGIMIQHTYPIVSTPSLIILDNTCYFGPTGDTSTVSTYCASLFNSSDAQLTRTVTDLPLQVQSISN